MEFIISGIYHPKGSPHHFPYRSHIFKPPKIRISARVDLTKGEVALRAEGMEGRHLPFSRRCIWMFPKIGGKPPKWMVYNGKPY